MIAHLKHLKIELGFYHRLNCLRSLFNFPFNCGIHAPFDRLPHIFTPLLLRRLLQQLVSKSVDTSINWIFTCLAPGPFLGKLSLLVFIIQDVSTLSKAILNIFFFMIRSLLNPNTIPLICYLILYLSVYQIDLLLSLRRRLLRRFG